MIKEDDKYLNKKRQNNDPQICPIPYTNTKNNIPIPGNYSNKIENDDDIIDGINRDFRFEIIPKKGRLDECDLNKNQNLLGTEHTNVENSKQNFKPYSEPKHNPRPHNSQNSFQKELPITKYRQEILKKLKNNQVIVIAGETGCGKTTQVPQMIYNDYKERGEKVNILITQPRRIAAVSISNRLAKEMGVNLGQEVGYHVGMRPMFMRDITKILIVTTGIFLQRIIHEKNLDEFTHIILDEVHERDIDIDFVLVLIKHILKANPNVKLILMSATISTHLFANYFSISSIQEVDNRDFYKEKSTVIDEAIKDECMDKKTSIVQNKDNILLPDAAPIVTVDEKIFPVHLFYLDKFLWRLGVEQNRDFLSHSINFDQKLPFIDSYLYEICFYLIRNIHQNKIFAEKNMKYSVLVFLPGFGEIATMHEYLLKNLDEKEFDEIDILRLHSNLTDEDQQKVFRPTPKRKVILSTNIAESSITISDIYYVIDFCLVKELKFNVKTNHETLDLNWASKASSNQRAGRAGRVGEGYVFRLVYQKFFDIFMQDFSSPEILRVPLEKIILKIKVWNCGEPDKILGRAIEPPKDLHIDTAINNLQNYGALTLGTKSSDSGELTELGKVYSEMPIDIKYSRLIMISYAFDMLDAAIVTASILSQEKNIFQKGLSSSFLYSVKSHFASETDSDMILCYNAYKDWENNFGKHLQRNIFDRKIFRGRNNNSEEDKWCKEKHLDSRILREVLALNADIKMRLNKLKLYNENGQKDIDFSDENNKTLYQFALAGAFYGKYIKCQFQDIEKIRKLKNNRTITHQINRSITIKGIPQNIEDKVIHEFFKYYGPMEYYRRIGEDVLIQFDEINYKSIIKKVMHIGSNFKMNQNDNSFALITYDRQQNKIYTRMKKPDYPYEVRLYDIFTSNQVEVDHSSINHVVIEDVEKEISSMFYIAEDYYLKTGRLLAKHMTRMPNKPMLDLILMLIFAPMATFDSNEEKNQYQSFRIVGSENDFKFSYLFSGIDIDEINSIRSFLNDIISSKLKAEDELKSKREMMVRKITKLIDKQRIKIISNEEWWRLFYFCYPEKLEEKQENLKMKISNSNEFDFGIDNTEGFINFSESDKMKNFIKSEEIPRDNNNQLARQTKNLDKRSNDFLPMLKKLEIFEDYRLWTEEGLKLLEVERNLFNDMRDKIIKDISNSKKLIYLEQTEVLCGSCYSYICTAKNLTADKEFFKMSGWISGFVNCVPYNNEEANKSDFIQNFSNEFNFDESFEWISCKQNNHFLGFQQNQTFYVARFSNLTLNFPTGKHRKWESKYWEDNFFLLKKEEKEFLHTRKELLNNSLSCQLCLCHFNNDAEGYLKHVDKDTQHKRMVAELLEEVF